MLKDSVRARNGLHKLQYLRSFEGPADQFWLIYIDSIADLIDAGAGIVVEKSGGRNQLKILASYPAGKSETLNSLNRVIKDAVEKGRDGGIGVLFTGDSFVLTAAVSGLDNNRSVYVLLSLQTADQSVLPGASSALMSVTDIPSLYHKHIKTLDVIAQREKLLNVLDLNVLLGSQNRFLSAAMTLCNELASAYKCSRVFLGWRKGSHIRLKAISQTDHFEKKMEIVQKVEAAMDEAADQNSEIVFPIPDNSTCYVRDHQGYMKTSEAKAVFTLPVRIGNDVVGVCLFERNEDVFTDQELYHLRMILDQVAVRLLDLQHRDRWFGARFADWLKRKISLLLGFEHTWTKLAVLGAVVLITLAATVPVQFRVHSPMILKTDDITFLAAPFDGYISAVKAKAGENVNKGNVLLSIDKKDLLLEEAGIIAEQTKAKREEDRARSASMLAEMRIAQSQYAQLQSRLDVVQNRLSQADVRSPFEGIIIEGDQHERIGAPVRQGEVLFRLGRIQDIRVDAKVSESDIHFVEPGAGGQIALASRPNDLFDITVKRIEPVAVTDESGNVFQVVCTFNNKVPNWFRPGMTGISKVEAGKKTLLWIISHRTIDFLRLKLWW